MDGRRATGAVLRRGDGSEQQVSAASVVLCAGALQSPVLLLRAGIGPGDALSPPAGYPSGWPVRASARTCGTIPL